MTKKLADLLKAASPGPWRMTPGEHGPATIYDAIEVGWLARIKESVPQKNADAALIVALVNAAPLMLDAVNALVVLRQDVIEAKLQSRSPANLTNWGEVNVSLDRAKDALDALEAKP